MILEISPELLGQIHTHGENTYPDEGAGFLLGEADEERKRVVAVLPLSNAREGEARRTRYMITPQDALRAEQEAAEREMDVIGVFHSHPDHPNRPSEFDREWAMPWFTYLITSVWTGEATESRAWRLSDDRTSFREEKIEMIRER